MIDPEQAAFRSQLRSRIRPPAAEPDDDWKPHPRWDSGPPKEGRRKTGPPPMDNPSPATLAVRRYRERERLRKQAEAGL